jgi:nicotinate phosphoribosyltransferase
MTVSLLTDRYELSMLQSFIADGSVHKKAVFETFARRLPTGRRYGIVAGVGRLMDLLGDFAFDDDEIQWLLHERVIDQAMATYLEDFRFSGDITAYREGSAYFPNSPVLTVEGTLGEAILLETLVLSVLNHDSAIASAAARMVVAAKGQPLIEMGSRRTHEGAAVAASRAAYIAGFGSTSNLAAGYLYDIPTRGTAAHAFTLSYETELEAFRSQVATHGPGTSLLVDTYDIAQGIRNAVEVAGPDLGAIRLDSGDPVIESKKARTLLDSLGAGFADIVVTSDLDEFEIDRILEFQAPVDSFGVGTRLVTGSGHPTVGFVYKLVEIEAYDGTMRPVAKKSKNKTSIGGRKYVTRGYGSRMNLVSETFTDHPTDHDLGFPPGNDTPQHAYVVKGVIGDTANAVAEARVECSYALGSLPADVLNITAGDAYLTAEPADVSGLAGVR